MRHSYIEFRKKQNFGDIINTYFTFLKYNFKSYANLYFKYNALSIILTLLVGYLLVTGFMGLASRDFRFGMSNSADNDLQLIISGVLLVLVLLFTSLVNYSFSSAYIGNYVKNKGEVSSKQIKQGIIDNLGKIILFILIGVFIYIAYVIITIVIAFIPLLGMLVQYGLSFTLSALFGLTFMSIFAKKHSFADALGEGFSFTFSNFWRVVLYGLVVGILNTIISALIIAIPSILMGIYVYFSVESNINFNTSTFATIIFTFGFAFVILTFVFSQALSQVAFGVLYYNLFEETYNVHLQEKINKIGTHDSI